MDLFQNAVAVRLRSRHDKYLTAEEDEESVTQTRDGSSNNARWSVELVDRSSNYIRLKSCYNKYLTASNQPFFIGVTDWSGSKVLQTLPPRLDSSLDWEPIRVGRYVKLKTRLERFLRAHSSLSTWRNAVTHDIPFRTQSQVWILWEVLPVEMVARSPVLPTQEQSNGYADDLPPNVEDGRTIYYHVADEFGVVDEGMEELRITFAGNGVEDLTRRLEEKTGMEKIVVCSLNPMNRKLLPLRLQLPPINVMMHVVVVDSSSTVAQEFA